MKNKKIEYLKGYIDKCFDRLSLRVVYFYEPVLLLYDGDKTFISFSGSGRVLSINTYLFMFGYFSLSEEEREEMIEYIKDKFIEKTGTIRINRISHPYDGYHFGNKNIDTLKMFSDLPTSEDTSVDLFLSFPYGL